MEREAIESQAKSRLHRATDTEGAALLSRGEITAETRHLYLCYRAIYGKELARTAKGKECGLDVNEPLAQQNALSRFRELFGWDAMDTVNGVLPKIKLEREQRWAKNDTN